MSTHGWKFLRAEDKEAIFAGLWSEQGPCAGPFHLELDPVDHCNADCYFCNSAEIRRGAVMPWTRIESILNEARPRGLRSIRLAGGGEATLHPEFVRILEWLEQHDVRLDNVTTNGVAITGRRAEALTRVPPSFLTISLNYATPESYEWGMRIPARNFDRVCENLEAYLAALKAADRRGECLCHLQFMISREVLNDLPAMFELAERLGANAVTLRGLYDRPPEDRLTHEEKDRLMSELAPLAHAFTDKFWIMFDLGMEGLGERAQALSDAIHAHHPITDSAGSADSDQRGADLDRFAYCLMPWYSMSVLGSGRVYPCCILLSDLSIEPLGDLSAQTLDEVWNGEAFHRCRGEIRRSMILDGPVPMSGRLCKHTTAMCWKAGSCHLASKLPDPPDVQRLADGIVRNRSSLAGKGMRAQYRLLRKGIDTVRAVHPRR